MNQIDELIKLAESQIGYKEDPKTGYNKYNLAYYGYESAQPWCVVFIWWLCQQIKAPELFFGGKKTASCGTLYNDYYKPMGMTVPFSQAKRGDWVEFTFNGVEHCHIGVLKAIDGDYVITIDGNTSDASSDNGGEVLERRRHKSCIYGIIRPPYKSGTNSVYYTVQPGDTLSNIGKKYNMPWPLIAARNKIKSPYTIYPGQVLKIK